MGMETPAKTQCVQGDIQMEPKAGAATRISGAAKQCTAQSKPAVVPKRSEVV